MPLIESLLPYSKEIVSIFAPLLVWLINSIMKRKPVLVWASPEMHEFVVRPNRKANEDPNGKALNVTTASLYVQNTGKETANNIELVFANRPQYFNIRPLRHYKEVNVPESPSYAMHFATLSPNESIHIELLGVDSRLPMVQTLRCDQCTGGRIWTVNSPEVAKWKKTLRSVVMIVGSISAIYLLIILVQFLILGTPKAI